MAAKHPYYEEKIKRAVRDALALDPITTDAALHERVCKSMKYNFDIKYIRKLRDKVVKSNQMEVSRSKITKRLGEIRETHRLGRERLLRIIYWSPENALPGIRPPSSVAIIEAVKALVMLDLAIMNAEVANGVYKDIEEAASHRDYTELPQEHRQTIVSAFAKWGVLPAGATAQITERTLTVHAPDTRQPTT